MSATKVYGFLSQAFIFATVMFVSNLISMYLPIPMPASVIGLVLLFVLLTTKIVKLEQVEQLGTSLTGLISFLFVPSGISVIQSLGVMQEVGVQVVGVIIIATIMLLAATGLFTQLLMQLSEKPQKRKETKESKSTPSHSNKPASSTH
ncbi:antiholin-like murein hydrolase modulator LrgA [Bacillus pumilus]|uniref:Antiholin-like murein hydrolase modulator LrgA n=1 Tax=Bacillus pumilus TaxID=1408 RepID=A0AAE4BAW6_BACPU|nr:MULTISPECIES: antiholin-like murein hydrolase modulator LrgA [Bacillus]MCY7617695.1 antiholin-like murein hydrolase modulator LrgA [Bacillus pumilus]MDF2003287.1 antiholin-like murein hydrolase modulator LrgA [Bacillus pumilus]MDF2024212.1 antiholin-like murein hydrolase modulator LrgA [Bacillus pumilus]MDF2028169.1 antiholin-like murein hydrolase modulator LrgA [Bacillus pumilus]MDF2089098.1 antiholin-like murein hydrolase modulator LrgA [Bacillus pumilus]